MSLFFLFELFLTAGAFCAGLAFYFRCTAVFAVANPLMQGVDEFTLERSLTHKHIFPRMIPQALKSNLPRVGKVVVAI